MQCRIETLHYLLERAKNNTRNMPNVHLVISNAHALS